MLLFESVVGVVAGKEVHSIFTPLQPGAGNGKGR